MHINVNKTSTKVPRIFSSISDVGKTVYLYAKKYMKVDGYSSSSYSKMIAAYSPRANRKQPMYLGTNT